jgi:CubicO group peptidase (beta-lactamase class C family)
VTGTNEPGRAGTATVSSAALDGGFPDPESEGGWRPLRDEDEVRSIGGFDPVRLAQVEVTQSQLCGGDSYSIVVVRHGRLVAQWDTFNVLSPTRFDTWSCTKSFTSLAWGALLATEGSLSFDTRAYDLIGGHPVTDERKHVITIGQLLSMTSGIAGERFGVFGCPTDVFHGPFEFAMGLAPNRFGQMVDRLATDPGEGWDYSDPGYAHLGLAFAAASGREMDEVLQERVLLPIGVESASWDVQGGSGYIGPHTNAHTGMHISAREFARVGHLMLHKGAWRGRQLLPASWVELVTRPSQSFNPSYGYGFWVNTERSYVAEAPPDLFAMAGYRSNRCYVVPSADLVVARVGSGPAAWDERFLIRGVLDAML